jgi:Tol biopolymer transport system component
MSPEQVRARDLDARTDIFSFGAVLYEMATGALPFRGESSAMICEAIVNRLPIPAVRLNPDVHADLERIIDKALEKDRNLRYQHASDMRTDLERLKRDSSSGRFPAQHVSSAERAPSGALQSATMPAPPQSSGKSIYYALAGILAIAILGAAAFFAFRNPQPTQQPVATKQWEQLTFFTDSAVYPALSPDGRILTFIRGDNSFFGKGQVYVKILPDGDPAQLTHDDLLKLAPVFSPDGSRIAYGSAEVWDTWVVPVIGGEPRLWLPNSSSLTWIEGGQKLLFSEIMGHGAHMVLVTTDESRGQRRQIYAPPDERSMVHHSYLSPDGKWVLTVEMDSHGSIGPCHVIPFDGSGQMRVAGPDGMCLAGAWSPDGKALYVTTKTDDFHVWRQAFPDGKPEQITFGPTSQVGIAVAADGKSFITSVGSNDNTVWVHDKDGDHQIASDGSARDPLFSADGHSLYFLVLNGQSHNDELWKRNLTNGQQEKLLPGYSIKTYDVSKDGKKIAFAVTGANGSTAIWIAPSDRSSSPVQLSSSTNDDSPSFLPNGDIVFRAVEGGKNFAYRMKTDGTGREKITKDAILDLGTVSPEGRWLVAMLAPSHPQEGFGTQAIPIDGGAPIPLCQAYCDVVWDHSGRFLYLHASPFVEGGYVLALNPDTGLPKLPDAGLADAEDMKRSKPIATVPWPPQSALDSSTYTYVRQNTRRNLYRIPLP